MENVSRQPSAPFGPKGLSVTAVSVARLVRDQRPGVEVHKWSLFRALCEAKDRLGLPDRALAVLSALLSFHPGHVLVAGAADLVVFPSIRELALRAHNIAPSTLRRQLACLVEAGFLLRRDSPNGKHFVRRDGHGGIDQAFGFDLGPLVARHDEITTMAEALRAGRLKCRRACERVSLLRREITKGIAACLALGVEVDLASIRQAYVTAVAQIPRHDDPTALKAVAGQMSRLAADVFILLERHVECGKSGSNESRSEHHIQDSKTESHLDSEASLRKEEPKPSASTDNPTGAASTEIPLTLAMAACPDLNFYLRHGVGSWRDFSAAADVVRPMLGISASAWEEARDVMGQMQAAIVVACILQRSDAIRSPGGYLRTLTRRAQGGAFSVRPMVLALIGGNQRRPATGRDGSPRTNPAPLPAEPWEVDGSAAAHEFSQVLDGEAR